MDHQLHPARLIEETFRHYLAGCWNGAERRPARAYILQGLFAREPRQRFKGAWKLAGFGNVMTQLRDRFGQLTRTARRLPTPERNGWRGAVSILYADETGFHA